MRRTQLFLDEDLWTALHVRARQDSTTISHLVREAVREKYAGSLTKRRDAMRKLIGIRKDWPETMDTDAYVRELRRDNRLDRFRSK